MTEIKKLENDIKVLQDAYKIIEHEIKSDRGKDTKNFIQVTINTMIEELYVLKDRKNEK